MLTPIWGYRPLLDITDDEARDELARAAVMALSYVAQSARGIGVPAVPQKRVDEASTIVERFMVALARRARPAARGRRRRLLDLGRRARHERLHLHRPGHRLHRCGRRGLAVRRHRRDERPAARRRPLPGAAHARRRRGVRQRRDLRQEAARRRRAPDGLRSPGLPRRGPPRPRAAPRRRGAVGPAVRRRAGAGAGGAEGAARAASRPPDRDQRRVLGRDRAGLRRGAQPHVHLDVHLRPHRGLVRAHPGAEAAPAGWSARRRATSAPTRASPRTSRAGRRCRPRRSASPRPPERVPHTPHDRRPGADPATGPSSRPDPPRTSA